MAATVLVVQYDGAAPGASTDVTSGSVTLGTSDDVSQASAIPIPSSGSNYSYWTHFALVATVAADNQIDNVSFYTDGTNSFGTGVDAIISTACAYDRGTGTAGSSGELLNLTNHTGLSGCGAGGRDGSTSPLFGYDSGTKLTIAGSIATGTGSIGDYFVVTQLNVESTAGAGNSGEETFTFEFDES